MYQGLFGMPQCSVRFPSRVTRSTQVHSGKNKKYQRDMSRSFLLNTQGRFESELHKKVEDDE